MSGTRSGRETYLSLPGLLALQDVASPCVQGSRLLVRGVHLVAVEPWRNRIVGVAVAIKRWEDFTGRKSERIDG